MIDFFMYINDGVIIYGEYDDDVVVVFGGVLVGGIYILS